MPTNLPGVIIASRLEAIALRLKANAIRFLLLLVASLLVVVRPGAPPSSVP